MNCINDTHLNTVLDEADVSAKHHYPAFFSYTRIRQSAARRGTRHGRRRWQ